MLFFIIFLQIFNVKPNADIIKSLIYSNIDCAIKDKDGDSVIEKLIDVILSEALLTRKRKIGKTF